MATQKIRILIVDDSALAARLLRDMLNAQPDMEVVDVVSTGQEGVRRASELHPDVVLMDVHLPDIDGIHATWLIASKNPDSSVIMISSEERTEYIQRAMVAGAQGYLLKPITDAAQMAEMIRTVRQRALERQALLARGTPAAVVAPAPPPQLARRVALFSPKGGQGKTTIAVNLAVALRLRTGKRVVLMDADLRFGDANILLDLPFGRSIVDLLPHLEELDSGLLDQVLAKHETGLELLIRPERPELAETIDAACIERVLTVMARSFDYVVIDCQVSYDEELLAVLDRSDVIFLVLHPELGALRNAKHFLQLAETLGYPRSKIAVIINRANSNVGITPQEVERVLGPGQYFRLNSYGRQLTSALNLGRPVVLANPKAEFSQIMYQLAEYVERAGNDRRG